MVPEPVVHEVSSVKLFAEELKLLGVKPKKDPDTGLWFYLWDDMFPMDPKGRPKPFFGAQETAKLFFGKSADWLRWRYHPSPDGRYPNGYFVIGDVILEAKRSNTGQRYYTLADIERMAHALAQNDAIDGQRVTAIVSIVLWVARLYEVV